MDDVSDKLIQVFLVEDPAAGMDPRHVKFVDMLILFRGNQTKAYKAAGYKTKSEAHAAANASRLTRNDKVRRLLAHRIEEARKAENMQLSQARVLRELNRISFSNMSDYATWDEGGTNFQLRASDDLSEDATACIKKIENTKRIVESDGESRVVEERTRIELYDKRSPLNTLAEATKLVDNSKPVVPVNINFNMAGQPEKGEESNDAERVVSDQVSEASDH